ncbi:hypothetical protein JX266_010951 [Neoarthrinium moseri]|nr:hypothetical protein JX266_010951 [Neoarthrinium moseri]
MLPKHSFFGHPIQLLDGSRELADFMTRYSSWRGGSCVLQRALLDPACLHAAMLVASVSYAVQNPAKKSIQQAIIHHKIEAVRHVNSRLQHIQNGVDDGVIACVSSLAIVECALGSTDDTKTHLVGLNRITRVRHPRPTRPKCPLLQSMVVSMVAWCLGERQAQVLAQECSDDTDRGPSINDSFERLMLANRASVFNPRRSLSGTWIAYTGFMWSYMYFFLILQNEDLDIFLFSFHLEDLLEAVTVSEQAALDGTYPVAAWMWAPVFGLCVLENVKARTGLERQQLGYWQESFLSKIRRVSRHVKIDNWEDAKDVLFNWTSGEPFDGEDQLKCLWERAVVGESPATSIQRPPALGTLSVFYPTTKLADDEPVPLVTTIMRSTPAAAAYARVPL